MSREMNNAGFNKILVVDDTSANLLLLTSLLTEHGYIVHPASDGELALEFVRSILPDLILLDIRMPEMDGYEVCRRLKADERTRFIPIIFISILEDERDKVKGFQAGGVDYITKPFQPEEVLARVRTHLSLRELAENLEQKIIERTEELMIANQRLEQEIAERKRAEEALRESEAKYMDLYENAPDMYASVNARTALIEQCNSTLSSTLGYSKEEIIGRPVFEIYHPDCLEEVQKAFKLFRDTGEVRDKELQLRRKDSSRLDVSLNVSSVRDEEGNILCSRSTLRDITDRKRAEEDLRLSQFMIDRAALGIFRGSEDGRILAVNEYWAQNLDYTPAELCSMSFFDIDPNLTPEFWREHRKKIADTGSNTFESVHRRKDGTVFPVEVTVNYLKYRGQEFSCSFAKDISERKKTEQQLRQASMVLENSPAVVFCWGASDDWPVEMVSGNVTRFGYTPEELLSGTVPYAALVHSEDLSQLVAEVHAQIGRGEDTFNQEYRIVTKQGEVRWVDERTLIERDAEGRVSGYQGVVIDITERKRTEQVMAARVRLLQFAATRTLEELLEATLNEAEKLTDSLIGFYHFLEDDQQTLSLQNWSTRTKRDFCKAQGKGLHYPVSQAGVWVDCIHQRQPVIHDDYAALPHRKGLPPSHAPVVRELVVPVFRGEKIVAILGVGNKLQRYTQQDVETVSLLADLAWEITERKQAEEALRESERKYRSIVEHAPFGITRSTGDGKLVSVNPALAAILKYDSAEELLETINRSSIQDVLFPRPSERAPLVENILSSDSWHVFNNRLRCKDGSIVTCRVHSRRIENEGGQANEFESFQENITEQVEAEQALRESEEKFRVLAETSPAAICIYQGERFIYANPAMERLFGYSADEFYRMKFWDWAHEDFRELVRSCGLARLAGEAVPGQYEARCLTRTGHEKYVLVSAGVMEYQGRPTGVASFLDISERKRTEELIRASLREKEVLLKEIHHRVKNNLQVVSSLLFLQAQKIRDPELAALFTESQNRIYSMALAHEQLYQSKNLADVRLPDYVESLVEEIEQVFRSGEKEVCCRVDVDDIDLDIEQVVPCGLLITELLSNALRHAFPGSRTGTVSVEMHRYNDVLSLTVGDDGVGLPADLDVAATKTLGLQLVRALTDQLDGTLELVRRAGAEFRVTFPARTREGVSGL